MATPRTTADVNKALDADMQAFMDAYKQQELMDQQPLVAIQNRLDNIGVLAMKLSNSHELADFLSKLSLAIVAFTSLVTAEAERGLAATVSMQSVED